MTSLTDRSIPVPQQLDERRRIAQVGIVLFVAVWMAACLIGNFTPHVDNVEQLTWVRSLQWGYYKHPPLPTWLLWIPVQLVGWSALASYLAAATTAVVTLLVFHWLIRRMRGDNYALIALMAAACTTYLNWGLSIYNHDSVLQLLSTLCAAATWSAIVDRRRGAWVAVGVTLGLGALTKYQVAILATCLLIFFFQQRCHLDARHRRGLLLAALIALVMFTPHLVWLSGHDFGPIGYAMESSLGAGLSVGERIQRSLHWLADQLLNRTLPAWLMLGAAALLWRPAARPSTPAEGAGAGAMSPARSMLLCWGLVPMVFVLLVCLSTGTKVPLNWGAAFLIFLVPAMMELSAAVGWSRMSWPRAGRAFLAMQAVLLLGYMLTSAIGPQRWQGGRWRNTDFAPIAQMIAVPARQQLGGPIRFVVGQTDVAGIFALNLPERPLVLIDGRLDRSPAVARSGAIERCGAIEFGLSRDLPGGLPIGPALPGWVWRVRMPQRTADPAPPR